MIELLLLTIILYSIGGFWILFSNGIFNCAYYLAVYRPIIKDFEKAIRPIIDAGTDFKVSITILNEVK